jgi:chromosome partitioning protein
MIIAVASNKGGVGKSTIAAHLAVWLHRRGHSTVLCDCDRQQSSSVWVQEVEPALQTVVMTDSNAIVNRLPLLGQEAEFVVCDGPGSDSDTSRLLLLRSDFAIVPAKASMLEARALASVTQLVREAQDIRNGPPAAVIVLSMVGKTYRLTKDMHDAARALSVRVAATPLTLRQAYADAPGQGTVVWDMATRARDAAVEIEQLFQELLPDIAVRGAVSNATTGGGIR